MFNFSSNVQCVAINETKQKLIGGKRVPVSSEIDDLHSDNPVSAVQ